ncbi:MAG: indole-3-glycerol phosphate synthase TrpC [Dehalococcoidia bacterium]|nr:indole-3-glycerol phosphate synthase TrpC [Dehalococcoidia bacterium]
MPKSPAEILKSILDAKAAEVVERQKTVPLDEMQRRIGERRPAKDFAAALKGDGLRLIAEVKRASPSRGLLRADFDPVAIAKTYVRCGVAAISVLTEAPHFQGALEHLSAVAEAVGPDGPPVLRKDFILHPYQVYEARAAGADALLLIVGILDHGQLSGLLMLARSLGMEPLVEVHTLPEVRRAVNAGARVIGINNRNLKTFKTDVQTTRRLRPAIPDDRVVVSESGLRTRDDLERVRAWGVDAVLIGEAFMVAPDIAARVGELMGAPALPTREG